MSEKNKTLANSAKVTIAAYRSGVADIGTLISRLEGIIQNFDGLSNEQKGEYWSQWGKLEDVYAELLDSNENSVEKEYASVIDDGLNSIEILLRKIK